MEQPRVIFVDDESSFRESTKLSLNLLFGPDRAFDVEFYPHPTLAIDAIKKNPFNVFLVFMDHQFREADKKITLGSDFIRDIKLINSYIEIIMMSTDTSSESLKMWLKNGVDKFIYKTFEGRDEKLQIFINESLTRFRSKFGSFAGNQTRRLNQVPDSLKKIGVVSLDQKMKDAADLVLQSASSNLSVLILGDTGTGKELFAKAVHENSNRKDNKFRTIDCTQFKKSELIASELFGSEKGAFTGAESKVGLLEIANGGTVFLDEVHHLSEEAQAMLLRFIQDRKIRRVGGSTEKFVDVRLLFAAKPVLKELVSENKFLADLVYRMKEIKIDLPPLNSRNGDIEILCEFFLEKQNLIEQNTVPKRLHPDALDVLKAYSWPGNVRELENLMKRLSVLVTGPIILPEHIEKYGELDPSFMVKAFSELESFAQMATRHQNEVRALILKAYQANDYNVTTTAKAINYPRTSLISKCKALGIWESMNMTNKKQSAENEADLKSMLDNSIRSLMNVITAR